MTSRNQQHGPGSAEDEDQEEEQRESNHASKQGVTEARVHTCDCLVRVARSSGAIPLSQEPRKVVVALGRCLDQPFRLRCWAQSWPSALA